MSFENGDQVALRKARLRASMAALWGRKGNPNPSLHTPVNVNVPNADVTLMSTNDLGVHGILVSANGHDVDGNRTDQTQYHIDLLYS